MRWTQYFLYTVRESPADADVISQKLMMRAGMIRKVAAGIYSYLPLGLRSMRKMEGIVRDEMNRANAVELTMPAIQPAELWMESGRWQKYGKELLRIRDRHERDFVFGPTHEEVITDIVRDSISSYRQLPVSLYQIQTKFRDEVRPRFGLMRGREFIMKDAYSFHTTRESLDETYDRMRDAYSAIFKRCGLDHVPVEADTGNIGGSASHEFMVLAQSGEDAVVRCSGCGYGANLEKATSSFFESGPADEPEPGALEEIDTPDTMTIDDVGRFLRMPTSKLVKTLVFDTEEGPVMVLVRGDRAANEIKIRNYLGAQQLDMLADAKFESVVGGPIGFCGPVGANAIRVVADESLRPVKSWITGANRKDAHLRNAVPGRDFQVSEFADFTRVEAGDACSRCGQALEIFRGIEVGHIFKLGTKYSTAMHCVYLDEKGDRQPMIMGCYGLGIGRTVAAAIEQSHDDNGIIWPVALAPFEVVLTSVGRDEAVLRAAEKLYGTLLDAGIEVLYDDRDERPGVKFKDADLIGFPVRITVGQKSLANGHVEWSLRKDGERKLEAPERVVEEVIRFINGERGRA